MFFHKKLFSLLRQKGIKYIKRAIRPKKVQLSGSFDNWNKNHDLTFDELTQKWTISLYVISGCYQYIFKFSYKYLVDNEWICEHDEP